MQINILYWKLYFLYKALYKEHIKGIITMLTLIFIFTFCILFFGFALDIHIYFFWIFPILGLFLLFKNILALQEYKNLQNLNYNIFLDTYTPDRIIELSNKIIYLSETLYKSIENRSIIKKGIKIMEVHSKNTAGWMNLNENQNSRKINSQDTNKEFLKVMQPYLNRANTEIQYIFLRLIECQEYLTSYIKEQQSTLEQAKSEVSAHIHGTDELGRVSELQKQRIDQQIAQFEELQRVLVKV